MNWHPVADDLAAALADPRYDMRSFDGLAVAVGAAPRDVSKSVGRHRHEVRFSPVRTRTGERLLTLRSRPRNWCERVSEVRHILASLA
jgi:hypothetical protein